MRDLPKYIDLAFCLVVLPVMIMIFPMERWFHSFQWYVITVVGWLYLLYLVNRLMTVPLLFRDSAKRWMGIGLIVISLGITYGLSNITLYHPEPNIHDKGIIRIFPAVLQYQQAVWSLFMIVEAFSFAIGLLTQTNLQRSRRQAVEAERDKAEIELYKAQIKPHFMFNTLNSLYGLFLTHDEKAMESLEKFIMMLRYIHTTSHHDFVALEEEADYIRQYVDLQSLRLNGRTSVALKIDMETAGLQVPSMLLVTFVENCFKHGVSSVQDSDITIDLHERGRRLTFSTSNHIFPAKRIGEHLGIKNCKKRLSLLYPGNHSLEIADNGVSYHVKLTIEL